jgi:hypothetical protein
MATSPNFNWPEPDNTDLVKNGALAIRTAVDAIDSSLVDLKGGTTGQVLAKASNTDMDFVWSADAAGISPTIFAAKGDLLGASANDTPAILSVGTNGETLVADSSTSTGLRYQAPKTQNAIYNSGFDIAQRGTSFTGLASDAYTLDQWVFWATSGGQSNTASQQAIGNLSVSPNQAIRYAGRFGRTAGTSSTGGRVLFQALETSDSLRFAGQPVTLSFYARAGANYSATANQLGAAAVSGTGTDQKYYNFTGSANIAGSTVSLTTSWQRFTITGTAATSTTQVGVAFTSIPTGTAGADDWFEITGIQLEVGSVATPYNRQNGTIQGELAACMRYFQVIGGNTADENLGMGMAYSTTNSIIHTTFQVPFRSAPSVTLFSGGAASDFKVYNSAATPLTPTSILGYFGLSIYSMRVIPVLASGLTAGNATIMISSNSNGKLFVSAEL